MTLPAAAPVCYFDVTDIVHYAAANARVSGIQRVQLNLIGHLVRRHGGEAVRCTFDHPRRKVIVEFDPSSLFETDELDSEMLLRRVGLAGRSRVFPSKTMMRRYLRPYSKRKFRRMAVKAGILLSALLWPQRLAPMGLRRPTARELAVVPVTLHPVAQLPREARFVCLGAPWSHPRVIAFGREHAGRGGTVVQLIYDLIPLLRPEFVSRAMADNFGRWLDDIVHHVRHFVCISRWTQASMREFVGARDGVRIDAVAMAHEFDGFARFAPVAPERGAAREAASEPFVLCVGTLEDRKNGVALLRAWQRLAPVLGTRLPRLVFAGQRGWSIQSFMAVLEGDPDLAKRVRLVDAPSDRELAFLYQRCLFTAFPSLSEGWGLPVGEAAWFGKFTLSSNATSLPEVCGPLVDYFDPAALDELCAALQRALADPGYVRAKEQAIVHSALRRWADVADDLWSLVTGPTCPVQQEDQPPRRAP